MFHGAFRRTVAIENRSAETVFVTLLARGHRSGKLWPAPIMGPLLLPALRDGRFSVGPSTTLTLVWDMDDHDLEGLVVETRADRVLGAPLARLDDHFAIDDFAKLAAASPEFRAAAAEAGAKPWPATILGALIVGPWIAYGALACLMRRYAAGPQAEPKG